MSCSNSGLQLSPSEGPGGGGGEEIQVAARTWQHFGEEAGCKLIDSR